MTYKPNYQAQLQLKVEDYLQLGLLPPSHSRLVSVGGDGTFNEVMHALIDRTQQKAGKLKEDFDTELLSPRLRIGIIPAGKANSSPRVRLEAFFKSWEITTKTLIQGSGGKQTDF